MCFAGGHRNDRTSTIPIVFCLFGFITGSPPSLARLRLSGRRTIIRWHRAGFRAYWRWQSRNPVGRPKVSAELRTLIGEMSRANPLWGAPHIHGELLKLGFEVAQSTVARYMCRHSRPPSQGWRTFLSNHADGIAAVDLFVIPTIAFRILYCLVIIRHGRRIWLSFGVTENPTAEWISCQITEAFPWDQAPRYLIRDRDTSYGPVFVQRLRAMGIRDRPIAFRSPWQNAYVERLIGSIRRECLDHMIVFGEAHLRRILGAYAAYYNESRTHRSLNKDAPFHRAIERLGAHHHVTPNSRWTSPPILQNLIFGTLRFSVHTGWTMSPPRCPGVRTPITRPIIPGLRTCSSVWRPLRDELRSRSSSLSLMQQKFPDRRDQQQISSN